MIPHKSRKYVLVAIHSVNAKGKPNCSSVIMESPSLKKITDFLEMYPVSNLVGSPHTYDDSVDVEHVILYVPNTWTKNDGYSIWFN